MRYHSSLIVLMLASGLFLTACGNFDESTDYDTSSERVGENHDTVKYCIPVPSNCSTNITGKADSARAYNASAAVTYATINYNVAYTSSGGQNPFFDYGANASWGNCTNFVSQVIMAGLTGKTAPVDIYKERYRFDIDSTSIYQWYFRCDCDRGPAFTSPNKLYEYAVTNQPSYKGLHFQFVTNDTAQTPLNVGAVRAGDIVFADFDANGIMDHAMVVTAIDGSKSGYNKIRLTFQSENKTNRGLGDINVQYQYDALFYVYRPVDYNPLGL